MKMLLKPQTKNRPPKETVFSNLKFLNKEPNTASIV